MTFHSYRLGGTKEKDGNGRLVLGEGKVLAMDLEGLF